MIICCVVILLLVLVVVSIAIWNGPDYNIAYVPVPILEWGFAGGMVAVIHRLAYGRYSSLRKLYLWVIARPVIGFFMSGVIYFIALAAAKVANYQLTTETQYLWLNAVAFIAAFNDKFADAVIGRFTLKFVPAKEKEVNDKS